MKRRACLPVRLSVVVALSSGVSACAWFGDQNEPAQLMDLPAIEKTLSRSSSIETAEAHWPRLDWWREFGDPVLDRVLETALAGNPDIKIAASRLRQSQAVVDAQGAELYPTIEANVSFSARRFSANSVQAKLAGEDFRQLLINPLVLRYHLDFWGRDKAALQSAIGRSLATAAELADARLLIASEVAGGYFDLQNTLHRITLSERIAADRDSMFRLTQIRFDAGLSGDEPVLQARIALNHAKQALLRLHGAAELQRYRLAALCGQGPDWGENIAIPQRRVAPILYLPGDLPLRLLSRRPDLAAARLQVEAAAEDIKVAETAFYPDVNLFAFTGLHTVSLTDILLEGSSLAYAVGPAVEFPIFEGGRLRANLSYAHAAYDAAVERYNSGLVNAVREVADALSRWRELDARKREQSQNLEAAEARSKLDNTLLHSGLSDRSLSLQSRIDENHEQLMSSTLETEQIKAAINVIRALGGGYSADALPGSS